MFGLFLDVIIASRCLSWLPFFKLFDRRLIRCLYVNSATYCRYLKVDHTSNSGQPLFRPEFLSWQRCVYVHQFEDNNLFLAVIHRIDDIDIVESDSVDPLFMLV